MNKMELAFFEEQYNNAVSLRDKTLFKTGATLLVAGAFGGLCFLGLSQTVTAILQMICCVLVWGICREEISDGLRALLKFRPTPGTFQMLALVTACANAIFLLTQNSEESEKAVQSPFAVVLFLTVGLSMGMKYLFVLQIIKNLDLIRDKKTYSLQVTDLSLSKKYIRKVCSATPLEDFPNVMRTSFDSDPVRGRYHKFGLLTILIVLIFSLVATIIREGMFLSAASYLLVICCSFAAELAFVLPYVIMQMRLRKLGSILLGNYSIEQLREVDTLLIKDTDLFPAEKNEVLNLRIRKPERSNDALCYIAALLHLSESPMEEAFHRTCPGIPEKGPTVLQWRVIKNYGIVATVNVDNVLLGNRHLMLSHNIQPWSPDKEAMLTAAGVHLMYLAINGEIVATMIFRYGDDPQLKKSAEMLEGEFNLLVDTMDCNINENMIQRHYDLSRTKISVPDPDEAQSVVETREELEDDPSPPVMISAHNALGILESIRRAKQLHRSVGLCITVQQISVLFGLLLTLAGILLAPDNLHWSWPLMFNLLWALPVPVIALFRKDKK